MPRDTQDKNKELTRFRVRDYHRLWSSFPACSANKSIFNSSLSNIYERTIFRSYMALKKFISYNPIFSCEKMVWAYPVSLAATEGIKNFFSFPLGTEMFHFPRSASVLLTNTDDRASLYPVTGFGHLRIKGCFAPPRSLSQLCHVLRRLWTPRHPPYTLSSLTTLFASFAVGSRRTKHPDSTVVATRFPIHLVFKERPRHAPGNSSSACAEERCATT